VRKNKLGVWLGVWVKLLGVSGRVLYQDKKGSTDWGIHQDWELVSIIQPPFHPNVTTAWVSKSMINPQNGWSKTRNHQWIVREFLLKVISPIVLMQ
jgi:hypothetical protein